MQAKVVPALLVPFAVLLLQSATAQTSAPGGVMFRVSVRVEVVDAQVINKKTRQVISSLQREDFQIYEDSVRQEISSFSQDELPISIVFLFDLTDSVRPVLRSLAEGAREVLQHLRPQDEVAVMVYSASAQVLQDSTTDRALAVAAIDRASRMESREAAFFNEGIFQAAAQLEKPSGPSSRRVILWLTDDVPNIPSEEVRATLGRSVREGSLHTQKDALVQVLKTGAVVCTLLKKSEISDHEDSNRSSAKMIGSMLYPPGDVYKYAQATGGQVIEASAKKMRARIAQLIDDLRLRYSLSYHPSAEKPKGKFCAIKVKVAPRAKSQGDVLVEAKQGYYR
jgi:VWFA-related protein